MPLTYGTTCTSVSDLSLRLGDRLDGLALSGLLSLSLSCWTVTFFCVLFLGALKGCMTCLFIVVYFFASATTTLDNTRTRSNKRRSKMQCAQLVLPLLSSPKSLHSYVLCLALAALSRPTCSALNLAFTPSNCQGPTCLTVTKTREGKGR